MSPRRARGARGNAFEAPLVTRGVTEGRSTFLVPVGGALVGMSGEQKKKMDHHAALQDQEYEVYLRDVHKIGLMGQQLPAHPLAPTLDMGRVAETYLNMEKAIMPYFPFSTIAELIPANFCSRWHAASFANLDNLFKLKRLLVLKCAQCKVPLEYDSIQMCNICHLHIPVCRSRRCWKGYWSASHRRICATEACQYGVGQLQPLGSMPSTTGGASSSSMPSTTG